MAVTVFGQDLYGFNKNLVGHSDFLLNPWIYYVSSYNLIYLMIAILGM